MAWWRPGEIGVEVERLLAQVGLSADLRSALSLRALGRPAPARRHRTRAFGQARSCWWPTRRWRLSTCPSRPRCSICFSRAQGPAWADHGLHLPRPGGGRVSQHSHRRHVSGPFLVELGPASAVFAAPRHPYTQALLAEVPKLDAARRVSNRSRASCPRRSIRPPAAPSIRAARMPWRAVESIVRP